MAIGSSESGSRRDIISRVAAPLDGEAGKGKWGTMRRRIYRKGGVAPQCQNGLAIEVALAVKNVVHGRIRHNYDVLLDPSRRP